MSSKYCEEGIKIIQDSMVSGLLEYLNTGNFPGNSPSAYMTAYSEVHKLADDDDPKSSENLFKYFKEVITNYVKRAQKRVSESSDEKLIDDFLKENEKSNMLIYWMKRIFTYLDKFYTKSKEQGSLCKNAMDIYATEMFRPLKTRLFVAVNKLIKDDRECKEVSRNKIKNILKITEEVDMKLPEIAKDGDKFFWSGDKKNNSQSIEEWYNNFFRRETENFIKDKAKTWINSMNAPEYINAALKYIKEEDERKIEYIPQAFRDKIDAINNNYLVKENAEALASKETGIKCMLKNKKDDEIKQAYELISRNKDSLGVIKKDFEPYIRERGDELYKNKDLIKDPTKFIPALISLKKEMDGLVKNAFNDDIEFQDTKNKAFNYFMNSEIYSKQLSNYTDFMMKRGFKGKSEDEINQTLDDIVNLFKCLSSKVSFQKEASQKLSDRLIQGKTLNQVTEKNFISKLKTEVGVTYVFKMTEMMNDLDKSKIEIDNYRKLSHRGKPKGFPFVVQVVSQSGWDIAQTKLEKIELPKQLTDCMEDFCKFYTAKQKNQKLLWCYGLGTIDLQYLYLQKNYISVSTLSQYCLLLALEKNEKLTLNQISGILGYNINLLLHDASGLVFNPSFNKAKQPQKGVIIGNFTEELKPDTEVQLNKNFICNSIKFQTIPVLQKKKGDTQDQEREEAIQMKKYQDVILQINITRIMKSRIGVKTTHVWLVSETAKQVDLFKAQPQQIKEAIEKLIEKGIMKRSEKDRTCYEYIA